FPIWNWQFSGSVSPAAMTEFMEQMRRREDTKGIYDLRCAIYAQGSGCVRLPAMACFGLSAFFAAKLSGSRLDISGFYRFSQRKSLISGIKCQRDFFWVAPRWRASLRRCPKNSAVTKQCTPTKLYDFQLVPGYSGLFQHTPAYRRSFLFFPGRLL